MEEDTLEDERLNWPTICGVRILTLWHLESSGKILSRIYKLFTICSRLQRVVGHNVVYDPGCITLEDSEPDWATIKIG